MITAKGKFGKTIEILFWIAALAVLGENIALLRQNRELREGAAPQIAAGEHLQMLSGVALDGHVVPVNLPGADAKLLFFTFSPGCPACQANQEGWKILASTLEQKGIHVLWVSRDPVDITREYCLKHGIDLANVVADPPFRTYMQLGLARVPNTVLVGVGGAVEKVWAGRLDQPGWASVFAYFGGKSEMSSQAQSAAGALTTGCELSSADTSAKNCK
jgi:peroxiredoxin